MVFRYCLIWVAALVVTIGAAAADGSKKPAPVQTFTGEIMDSLCARYKGHSYMMQQMKSMGGDKKTCVRNCINQLGSKYVLFDTGQQAVYRIDNPDKVAPLAGHTVRISGVLLKKNRIKVDKIQATD